jgi:hypothetical protein
MTTLDFSVLGLVDRLRMAVSVLLGLQVEVGSEEPDTSMDDYFDHTDFVDVPREDMN